MYHSPAEPPQPGTGELAEQLGGPNPGVLAQRELQEEEGQPQDDQPSQVREIC